MFIATKIIVTDSLDGRCSPSYISRAYNTEAITDLSVTLYDTITKTANTITAHLFSELVDKLVGKPVYGFMPYTIYHEGPIMGYRLFCMTKLGFSFLDYIDSVDIVPKSECAVDLSSLERDNKMGFTLLNSLGWYNTFFYATFAPDDSYAFDETSLSIFDAVCLMPSSFIDGNFYLPVKAPNERSFDIPDDSWVCRVTCNNPVKAQSLVARSAALRPNLAEQLYNNIIELG